MSNDRAEIVWRRSRRCAPTGRTSASASAALRAASKNSRVNSAATPAIHGLDGSDTITSYCRGVSCRCVRPSPMSSRTPGASSTCTVFALRTAPTASTTSGEISTMSRLSNGLDAMHGIGGDAAAQTDDERIARIGVQRAPAAVRAAAASACRRRSMRRPCRRWPAIVCRRGVFTLTVPAAAFLVVLHSSRAKVRSRSPAIESRARTCRVRPRAGRWSHPAERERGCEKTGAAPAAEQRGAAATCHPTAEHRQRARPAPAAKSIRLVCRNVDSSPNRGRRRNPPASAPDDGSDRVRCVHTRRIARG